MGNTKIIDGVVHVWSIHDNAWVTLAYWEFINGRPTMEPSVRPRDVEMSA